MRGLVGAAAGLGNFAGNATGARLKLGRPALVVLRCTAAVTAIAIVVAAGELDAASASDLTELLRTALRREHDTLTIDLSGITFCDSSGLNALIAAPGPRPVQLQSPSPALRRLLELTGTVDHFEIVP